MSDSNMAAVAAAVVDGDQAAFGELYDCFAEQTYSVFRHDNDSQAIADEEMFQFWLFVWRNAASIFHSETSPRVALAVAVSQWPHDARPSQLAS